MLRPTCRHSHEMDVRHSRFRADIAPVASVEEAMRFLDAMRVPDATHQAWAYRVGSLFRAFDDGEPGGTAGRPILSAIDLLGFDGVMAIVTRWYGGVKLGAGGLVRAYGGAAAACLRAVDAVAVVPMVELQFLCPFSELAIVRARLDGWGAQESQCDFTPEGAHLALSVPQSLEGDIVVQLRDLTRGRMTITRHDA